MYDTGKKKWISKVEMHNIYLPLPKHEIIQTMYLYIKRALKIKL